MYSLFDYEDRLAIWLAGTDDDISRQAMISFIAGLCEEPDQDLYFVEWSADGHHARLISVPGAGPLVYMVDQVKRQIVVLRVCDP